MDVVHKKAGETRRRNAETRRERYAAQQAERAAQIAALRQIRDDPNATPGERLEAVRLIEQISSKY